MDYEPNPGAVGSGQVIACFSSHDQEGRQDKGRPCGSPSSRQDRGVSWAPEWERKNRIGRGAPPPCCLPDGGDKPPCWSLPDLTRKPLIENVLSPMNREIFGLESIFSLSAGRRRKEEGRPQAPLP